MKDKISKAIGKLNGGAEISIKGFGYLIEKVVLMTEIIKERFSRPIYQETVFLREKEVKLPKEKG